MTEDKHVVLDTPVHTDHTQARTLHLTVWHLLTLVQDSGLHR